MADDRKRSNTVSVRLTDRELLDASKQAVFEDMTLGEFLHFVIRRNLYGSMGAGPSDGKTGGKRNKHLSDD